MRDGAANAMSVQVGGVNRLLARPAGAGPGWRPVPAGPTPRRARLTLSAMLVDVMGQPLMSDVNVAWNVVRASFGDLPERTFWPKSEMAGVLST